MKRRTLVWNLAVVVIVAIGWAAYWYTP